MPPEDVLARVPFNRSSIVGSELDYILEAVGRSHASSGGDFTRRCSRLLVEALGAADVLLTTSCTDALEMSALHDIDSLGALVQAAGSPCTV